MPTEREPLIEDRVAGLEVRVEPLGRLAGVGDEFVGVVFAGDRADADDEVDPGLAGVGADLAVEPATRPGPSSPIIPSTATVRGASSVARWSSAARIDTGLAL